jgi:hypothetical protein
MLRNPLRVLALLLAVPVMVLHAQTAANYDAIVKQGKAQLQAGNNDSALASANAAIKLDATRWEAYVAAGGALMNLKRYEEAADDFSKAIERAPEAKQTALRDLRKQCLVAEAGAAPASSTGSGSAPSTVSAPAPGGPSFGETVRWIQNHMAESGFPAQTVTKGEFVSRYDDAPYSIHFDGCTMVLSLSEHVHGTNTQPNRGDQTDWDDSEYMKFKLPLHRLISIEDGGWLPLQDWEKNTINNGYRDSYVSGRFPTVAINLPGDGAGTASWGSSTTIEGAPNPNQSTPDHPIPSGALTAVIGFGPNATRNAVLISYGRPDTEDSPQHMAKALEHLVDLCHQNPVVAPKDTF